MKHHPEQKSPISLTPLKRVSVIPASVLAIALFALMCGSCGGGTRTPARGPGAGSAAGKTQFETLSVRLLRAMGSGKTVEAGRIERPLALYREQAVSLLIRTLNAQPEESNGKLHLEQRFEIGAERVALPALDVDCSAPATCVAKEWLELELRGPGGASRRVERVLRVRAGDDDVLPGYRRYTIVALAGAVARDDVQPQIAQRVPALKIEERKAKIEALQAEAAATTKEKVPALVARMDDLDVGGQLAQLMALGFAAESDAATDRLGQAAGVTVQRNTPRILIVGAEGQGDDAGVSLSLDLRLDEVDTAAGDDSNAARAFQLARGLEQSMLEGKYLAVSAGQDRAVSTALLMSAAAKASIATIALAASDKERFAALGLPPGFASVVQRALDGGHHVVLPSAAVELAGRPRWGFWDIDPATGRTIGVMEDGQHQGMMEVPVTTTRVPLNSSMGFVLGLHAGAVTGQFALSGLMLKHGEVTPVLIQELKNMLANVGCMVCPQATVGTSVSVNAGECLKKDLVSFSKGGVDFCAGYQDGFKCAVSLLLASLEGTNPSKAKVSASAPTLTVGCQEISVGGG